MNNIARLVSPLAVYAVYFFLFFNIFFRTLFIHLFILFFCGGLFQNFFLINCSYIGFNKLFQISLTPPTILFFFRSSFHPIFEKRKKILLLLLNIQKLFVYMYPKYKWTIISNWNINLMVEILENQNQTLFQSQI